jgi:hypothetical protein
MVKRKSELRRLADHNPHGVREHRRGPTTGRTRRQNRAARDAAAWDEIKHVLDSTDGSLPAAAGQDLRSETEQAVREEELVDAYFPSIRGGSRSTRKRKRPANTKRMRQGKRRRRTQKRGKREKRGGATVRPEATWHQNALADAARTHAKSVAAGYTQSLVSQLPKTDGPITGQHVRALAGAYALSSVKNHLGSEGQLAGRLTKALGEGKLANEFNRVLKDPKVQAAAGGLAASVADILADAAEKSTPQVIEAANKFVEAAGKTVEMDGVIVLTAIPPFDEIAAGGELVDVVNQDITRGERIATDGAQAVGKAEGAVEAKQAQFHQALDSLQSAVHSVPGA